MKQINVGMIGLGTVGSGVAQVLLSRRSVVDRRAGIPLVLKRVCVRNTKKKRDVKLPAGCLTKDVKKILNDPDIHMVVELAGGVHPAKEWLLEAMKRGKSVVTANKALLAEHGAELFKAAAKAGVDLYFETAVAGGIPIIKTMREGLTGNHVEAIYGILNGTSNFILTEMSKPDGHSFEAVLKEAQARGYAEQDPSLDINGGDTAHKIAILAQLAFGKAVKPSQIYTEGITSITTHDVRFAAEFGYCIKLLGIAKPVKDSLEIRVHPVLLPKKHVLANVHGVFNAVSVKGDRVGELVLYGQGAGRWPSASAVLADIVDVARNLKEGAPQRICSEGMENKSLRVRKMGEVECRYYLRVACIDEPGVLAKVSDILGKHGISIARMVQTDRHRSHAVPLMMVTHEAQEKNLQKAIKQIERLKFVQEPVVCIRMERT